MRLTLRALCRQAGISPQAVHKDHQARMRREVDGKLLLDLASVERGKQPRLGMLKLWYILRPELAAAGVPFGRDRFAEEYRRQGLVLERLPKAPGTTMGRHSLPVFPNRIRGLERTGPNQAWCADITYLRGTEAFYYLSLILDMWSHMVVGFHLARTLDAEETLKALEMALKGKPSGATPIHHSDRGCQYCCHDYVRTASAAGLTLSMTEINHCAENAMAERLNGIMKQEYFLEGEFKNFAAARRSVESAIFLYNTRRPHRSLGMRIPAAVHRAA